MMKKFINIIQSSSLGNCIALDDNKSHLFLDFGADKKYLRQYYGIKSLASENIAAILITHEHIDHIRSLESNLSNGINVYSTDKTWDEIEKRISNRKYIKNSFVVNNKWTKIKNTNWSFKAIPTIHNAIDPICYIVKNKRSKILYLTDTEYFENKSFNGLNIFLVESNYGSYIANSISVERKHLTNINHHMNSTNVEKFLKKYVTFKTKLFLMIHLSSKCHNNFEILDFMAKKYSTKKLKVTYVKPNFINKTSFHF